MKFELVDHWRTYLWGAGVNWVSAFWGALGGIIVLIWPVAQWAINEILPRDPLWRIPFALLTVAVTAGSLIYARSLKQPKLQEKIEAKAPDSATAGQTESRDGAV